jgi:transcriptional regulator with XRE-family HTH domain
MQGTDGRSVNRHIGAGLLLARTVRGATLKELASATGLSLARLERLEGGKAEATPRDLLLLAGSLGIPVQFFFEGLEEDVHDTARNRAAGLDFALH